MLPFSAVFVSVLVLPRNVLHAFEFKLRRISLWDSLPLTYLWSLTRLFALALRPLPSYSSSQTVSLPLHWISWEWLPNSNLSLFPLIVSNELTIFESPWFLKLTHLPKFSLNVQIFLVIRNLPKQRNQSKQKQVHLEVFLSGSTSMWQTSFSARST